MILSPIKFQMFKVDTVFVLWKKVSNLIFDNNYVMAIMELSINYHKGGWNGGFVSSLRIIIFLFERNETF